MIIGVSSGHDASACLLDKLGNIVYAIMEERITRVKHQSGFPINAVDKCIEISKGMDEEVEKIVYSFDFSKATKLKQLFLEFPSYLNKPSFFAGGLIGLSRFNKSMNYFAEYKGIPCYYINHHLAHAYSVYFYSNLNKPYTLVMDGRGETESMTLFDNNLKVLEKTLMPHSLGIFYSAITQLLGFKAGDGEYKVMGLASYGVPRCLDEMRYIINFEDGKLKMDLDFFYQSKFFKHQLNKVIGKDENLEATLYTDFLKNLLSRYDKKDIAKSAQVHLEELLVKIFNYFKEKYKIKEFNLVGGLFLNIVANKRLKEEGFKIFAIPFAGDDGSSVGSALYGLLGNNLNKKYKLDNLYFGDEYYSGDYLKAIEKYNLKYQEITKKEVAKLLYQNKIIGWFQGRDEFGARALGNRSILASPLKTENRDKVNLAIKFREDWRPFCPSMIYEDSKLYLKNKEEASFMNLAFNSTKYAEENIPAVVHIDKTLRPQTVRKEQNENYYNLLKEFKKISRVGVLLNTSFNRSDEPIVHTPEDAIKCFLGTKMDYLVLGDYLIEK